ncbi:hypothetical protein GCG21_09405 [Pseudactinotalea sp. HY160]|uniref:hypothetical protein n=1 Tax=Pseudactinotalea sp. HY160 TaxID=2654490 RepID=UPI00128D5026|nr:hypothetical protein [Pseudactinotalea sp. HY160]MPV50216.1 hypothetical protein [Pseudactinotalea sp. HY160]
MRRIPARTRFRLMILIQEWVQGHSRDAEVGDARRLALVALSSTAYRDRERARVAAVDEANRRRNPSIEPIRPVPRGALTLTFVGFLLGAAGIVPLLNQGTITRRSAPLFSAEEWMIPAGMLALISIALLAWLEPLRARGRIYHGGWEAAGYLVPGSILVGFPIYQAVFALDDIRDPEGWTRVIAGSLMMCGAGVWAILLWRRGRASDAAGLLVEHHDPLAGLTRRTDAEEIYVALDAWWEREAQRQLDARPDSLEAAAALALEWLANNGVRVRLKKGTALTRGVPAARWREPRG